MWHRIFFAFFAVVDGCLSEPPKSRIIEFAFDYFRDRGVSRFTSVVCWDSDKVELIKRFSKAGISSNSVNPSDFDPDLSLFQLTSKYLKLGILLDLECDGSTAILKIAHENDLFVQTKSLTVWLILMETHIPQEELESKARSYQPVVSDPVKYLTEPYKDTNNSDLLTEINRNFNADFIRAYRRPAYAKQVENATNITGIDALLPLNILLDNQVVLAIPGQPGGSELFGLYKIMKVTKESKVRIIRCGVVTAVDSRAEVNWTIRESERKSLEGALLKCVTAIYSVKKFTRLDDLRTRDTDVWAKMSYSITQLLQDGLNFSVILRFFDDYGWMKNGSFNGLMGYLERKKADLSAAGLLFRMDRYPVVDYLDSPFRLQTGILFREPSLSSVSNIFLLPFAPTVWFSMLGIILLIIIALKCETVAGERYRWLRSQSSMNEIIFFVVAAVGQQGYHQTPNSNTGRLIFFLLLFTSLALFTAFSAKIVAVMQSFSTSILSIKDITHSSFDVGIQPKFPFFDVSFQEAIPVHEVIREFYYKKVQKSRGPVYFEPSEGIEKIRRGLFAYEVELTVGYKLISDTYEEIDKCGLKEIDAFPKPFLGTGLQKHSPFRETFVRRVQWNAEVGLITREWKRWIPQKPNCEAERIGFLSVGFNESYSAIMIFIYGFALSAIFLLCELLHQKISNTLNSVK